jgi:hypothetical protein
MSNLANHIALLCSHDNILQEAAPFTVRSTPDFASTNGMEQNMTTTVAATTSK